MLKRKNRMFFHWLFSVGCLLAVYLAVMMTESRASDIPNISFSLPDKVMEMPDGWVENPLQYQEWAKGADIAVSLDQHYYGILQHKIEAYAEKKGVKIALEKGTCGISGGLLAAKAVDIAGFCCPPGTADRLPGVRFHTIGITPLTILVNSDNPTTNISYDQAKDIFVGKIRDWDQVHGSNDKDFSGRIQVITRLHCKLRPGHWRTILPGEDFLAHSAVQVGKIEDVIKYVAGNTYAIGGFESWHMAFMVYPQKKQPKALSIDGVSPLDQEALLAGRYPLYFVFNITTWEGEGLENRHVVELLDYLKGVVEQENLEHNIIPASKIRRAGWYFSGDELVGEPL